MFSIFFRQFFIIIFGENVKLKSIVLLTSHGLAAAIGFAGGIYTLPILTAPPAPSTTEISEVLGKKQYSATFRKDLKDSDALHWGEGRVSLSPEFISLEGKLAPGPDYM